MSRESLFSSIVPSLPAEALAKLVSLKAKTIATGDVYVIPEALARYWESTKARPALVVRVQRSAIGDPAVAYLVYGTTGRVRGRRRFPVAAGEADLRKDTTFDLGPWLELPAVELAEKCERIGALSAQGLEKLEPLLATSDLPFRSLPR